MMALRISTLTFSACLLSGCVHQMAIVRPDERQIAVNFSSDRARETFTCTLARVKHRFPEDKKQKESASADLLFISLYRKDYFLSEAAYFNHIVEKTDLDKNMVISKEEANSLYMSYFPGHKYIQISPEDGLFRKLEANIVAPLCDIHAET